MFPKVMRFSALILAISSVRAQVPTSINLGTASAFGVIASSAITNTGPTTVDGQIGISPGGASSVTGFPAEQVIITGAVAAAAKQDAQTAYGDITSLAPTRDITGQELGGQTLFTGTYFASSSIGLTGTLTLDAQGNPNAQFVFQIGSTITTASNSAVELINGARPCNVFWRIGSSATLGTGTSFIGNIIAQASITVTTGASVDGGLYALTAAVTLDSNQITAPGPCPRLPPPPPPPPSSPTPDSTPSASSASVSSPASISPPADTASGTISAPGSSSIVIPGDDSSTSLPASASSTSLAAPSNPGKPDIPGNPHGPNNPENSIFTTSSGDVTSMSTSSTGTTESETTFTTSSSTLSTMEPQSSTKSLTYKISASESWKTHITSAPSNFATITSEQDKATRPAQYGITSVSQGEITTINGTPCTTISYYEPTCSCTTTTIVPLAFTPMPTPDVEVLTVNGIPCTTSRYYDSKCDCIRTSNVPLQVVHATAAIATTVNGVPCVTSKYFERACDCVRTATVPVRIASAVSGSDEGGGVAATACAVTGQALFACMSACMEPYMPMATETVLISAMCSATPRYRM